MTNDTISLKKTLKQLKKDKGEIASQFKHVERDSQEFVELKRKMAVISAEIKTAEEAIKQSQSKVSPGVVTDQLQLPSQFEPARKVLDQPITISVIEDVQNQPEVWSWVENAKRSFYHQQAFTELLHTSLGLKPILLVAKTTPDNQIVGVLPLCLTISKIFGRFATSLPHVNYGGPISEFVDVTLSLVNELPKICKDFTLSHIEVRSTELIGDAPHSQKKVSMLKHLPDSIEQFNRALGAKVRAQTKKATVAQPTIQFGGTELLNDFYTVFSQNMRDLGTPVYAKQWFKDYLQTFSGQCELSVAYVDSQPVSCGFLVYSTDMVEIPWASTLRKANKLDMNMWMYYQILCRCIQKGYSWFDFGRSTLNAGTFRFKKQWGAKPVQHHWYKINESGFFLDEGLNPDNPKFKLAISLWQRMPVMLTNMIGPLIAKDLV